VIRAVLDTNVLASGFVEFATAERTPARLLRLWREQYFALVVSAKILTEPLNTFADPYFRRQLTPEQIHAAQVLLQEEAIWTPVTAPVSSVATHPEDDRILAAAVIAQAEYLVTGDKKLQQLGTYQGVRVVSPRTLAWPRAMNDCGRRPPTVRFCP
jgi:putative PIN family toxin of toxin-antitoxin system